MLSDLLCEAVHDIEKYEKNFPKPYAYWAEDTRRIKLEMLMLHWRLNLMPPIEDTITPADFEWVRKEALKRGTQRPPFEFAEVFAECMADFWTEWKKTNDLDAIMKRPIDRKFNRKAD